MRKGNVNSRTQISVEFLELDYLEGILLWRSASVGL